MGERKWVKLLIYRWLLPIAIGAFGAVVANWAVGNYYWLNELEVLSAEQAKSFAKFVPANAEIIVVKVTPRTPGLLNVESGIPRKNYAKLIELLRAAGARSVCFDIRFKEPKPSEDAELIHALRETSRLQVSLATDYIQSVRVSESDFDYVFNHYSLEKSVASPSVVFACPLAPRVSVYGVSCVLLERDPTTPKLMPHLGFAAALQYLGIPVDSAKLDADGHVVTAGARRWDLEGNDDISIHWLERYDPFESVELSHALKMLTTAVGKQKFRDALVVVGFTGTDDVVDTVQFGQIDGCWFVANFINTLLMTQSARMTTLPPLGHWLWCLFLAVGAAGIVLGGKVPRALLALTTGVGLSYFVPVAAAGFRHVTLETVAPMLGAIIAFAAAGVFEVGLALPLDLRTAGQHEDATALFVDIEGSTGLTQTLGAAEYGRVFASYMAQARKIVESSSGAIERTTGDGFLAIFRGEGGAKNGALAIPKLLDAASAAGLSARVGMEAGTISGSFVWEAGRKVWSSSGDAVNLAARLQAASADLGVRALVGPRAASRLGVDMVRLAGEIRAKGFDLAIPVFVVTISDKEV